MKKVNLPACAVVNDLSGYGRCALNITIPVMSALGVRVLSAPTAILSNHTAFCDYYFSDLTPGMENYFSAWEKLSLSYDGIFTGFLGSEEQVDIISEFIKKNRGEKTLLFVDPVMGDDGKLYSTYTEGLVNRMRELIDGADVITPNLTEACFLAGCDYREMESADDKKLLSLAKKLSDLGADKVIITGIYRGDKVSNIVCSKSGEAFISSSKYVAGQFCGTGDLFASLICGYLLKGMPLRDALSRSSKFICRAAKLSERLGVSPTDGIAFEPILKKI